jgi:hypothetical protein
MNSEKKSYELYREILLLAERFSLEEIQMLKIKLKDPTFDEKISELFDIMVGMKDLKIKKRPLKKKISPKSAKYESQALKDLRQSDLGKYAILKPIEDALINDENRIKFASIKELVLELDETKKNVKSRKEAIRFLIRVLSKMTKEEIEGHINNLYLKRKEGRLDELANLIMGETASKI